MPGRIGWKSEWQGIEEDREDGYFAPFAEVVELVDALRSGRSGRKPVRVRVPPSACWKVGEDGEDGKVEEGGEIW
jgi:hypothetical protein